MTTQELTNAYALAARPYQEAPGPIPASVLGLKSWRFLLELNTSCNLHCALCTVGNRVGYAFNKKNELMKMDLLEAILDKMKSEYSAAIVCPYGNSEPMLHPLFPECIAAIKRRGFRVEVATNLNHINRLDEFLAVGPDFVIVSVSGFTQEVYGKNHHGGDIERVKANLKLLKEASDRTGGKAQIAVSYHMYNDNLHEVELMREFVKQFGFLFMLSWARTISIENTVQSLRQLEQQKTGSVEPYVIGKDGLDLNKLFPAANPDFTENMNRLRFHPKKAVQFYERFPVAPVCIIADVFTYIRHDGKVQLCAWCDDTRLTLGNYLEMNQEQLSEARRGHSMCHECLRYRLPLYYHVVDAFKWDSMNEKFND